MKKLSLLFFALVLSVGFVLAQKSTNQANAEFAKTTHDFGKVAESAKEVTTQFTFKNTGTTPLIIQRVQATCGCTTPNYSKEPILPGKTGSIDVTYSTTGRVGAFNKKITVFSNVPDSVYVLTITGEVLRK